MSGAATAHAFLDALETGKGWETCQNSCLEDATFSLQTEPAAKTITLMAYAEWMRVLMTSIPDARYRLKSLVLHRAQGAAFATAELYGTRIGEGGPVPLFGNSVVSDYTYIMTFDDDRICHLTKVWSDVHAVYGKSQPCGAGVLLPSSSTSF